ncbi:hypothetical protein IMSHALPRED_002013 [Imshaugia aleurites]|uniref:F-box domain-containing protein n=1 Tax=Imshaugia aleurites TaxID=172621 RepID=A0A8H3PHG0_9LECA|nr:hypothetical protein IMSHALPRED_002013 [Imshaugia aleurites]
MSFNALPTELIYHISRRVQPADLESYGRTSRRVRDIAAPFVQEHRQLKAEYTKISVNHVAAAQMLYEMCARPWIALHPESVELRGHRSWRNFEGPRNRERTALVAEVERKRSLVDESDLRELLRRTRLILPHEMDGWLQQINTGDEDHLFALMIACLPNIRRLTIRLDHTKLEQVKEMIRSIKRQIPDINGDKALSKLKNVYVLEKDTSENGVCDLEMFPLLASLPGIQSMHGRNLVGMYRECYRDGWLDYPGASPTIEHIFLETCGMSVEGLEKLCNSIKALRSFKYIAHRAGWGLHRISDLLKNAGGTLEELVLSTGSGQSRFIGTLRGFRALKHVKVDTDMLFCRGKMSRAVDILPASIETATIAGNSLTRPHEEQFLSDLYRPSFSYPNLRKLQVEDSWGHRDIGKDRLKFQKEFHKQTSSSWMLRYR